MRLKNFTFRNQLVWITHRYWLGIVSFDSWIPSQQLNTKSLASWVPSQPYSLGGGRAGGTYCCWTAGGPCSSSWYQARPHKKGRDYARICEGHHYILIANSSSINESFCNCNNRYMEDLPGRAHLSKASLYKLIENSRETFWNWNR